MIAVLVGCLFPGSILAYTDARYRMLYNKLTLPLIGMGLIYSAYQGNMKVSLMGFGFAFAIMFIGALMGGLAGGDVKLAAGLGLWFGYPNIMYIIIISCLMGFVWGLMKLYKLGSLTERMGIFFRGLYLKVAYGTKGALALPKIPEQGIPEDSIPYGTFMIIATWIVFLKGVLPCLY